MLPLGYLSTVTLVILSASATCPILASPTTEPGRRGWKRRLGSPLSAPHFFAPTSCPHLEETSASKPHFALRVSPVPPCSPLCTPCAPCGSSFSLGHKPPRFVCF